MPLTVALMNVDMATGRYVLLEVLEAGSDEAALALRKRCTIGWSVP